MADGVGSTLSALIPFGIHIDARADGSRYAISLRDPSIGEPENRRFDSPSCRCRGGPTRSSHPRTEESRRCQRHRSCRSHETAADPRFATVFVTRDGSPSRLAARDGVPRAYRPAIADRRREREKESWGYPGP